MHVHLSTRLKKMKTVNTFHNHAINQHTCDAIKCIMDIKSIKILHNNTLYYIISDRIYFTFIST